MSRAHSRRAARNFATSSRKSEWQAKKNEQPRRPTSSRSSPRGARRAHVRERVREGEGDLLRRRGTRLADVIAGDRDRVPVRQLLGAVGEHVARRAAAKGPAGRCRCRAPRTPSGCRSGPCRRQRVAGDAAAPRDGDVEREQDRRGRVDRHRGGDALERDAVEERSMSSRLRSRRPRGRPRRAPAGRRSRTRSASAGRRPPRGRSCPARAGSGSGGSTRRRCRSRRTAASSRAGRGTRRVKAASERKVTRLGDRVRVPRLLLVNPPAHEARGATRLVLARGIRHDLVTLTCLA